MKYKISVSASNDIDDIWLWLAKENINSADNFLNELYKIFDLLCEFPLIGSMKPDFTDKNYRWIPIQKYWIAYKDFTSPLEIARVISAYRDIQEII
jgi:toxin ParE1/3/4